MASEDIGLRKKLDDFNKETNSERKQAKRKLSQTRIDKPIHQPHASLFSSSSGYTNYRGFLNLCVILLVLSNTRVALENIIKYGILVDPVQWISVFIRDPYNWPSASLLIGSNIFILVTYFLELLLSKNKLSENIGAVFHVINLVVVIIFPASVVLYLHPNPICSSLTLAFYSIIFMKLMSYIHVNYWCRTKSLSKFSGDGNHVNDKGTFVAYPGNLYLKDLYYFLFAPTLCYELNFPKNDRMRKRFIIRRFAEILFLLQLILSLVQQWIVPTLQNSKPFHEMEASRSLERLLKLSIPNHLIWLITFYWYFHSCLNFVAEILHFADREFYLDWWNAESVENFWQNWNIPVHRWALRHVYCPMLESGFTKRSASLTVFVASAFFHEYLVSVPLRMFRIWAFSGMVIQVPFALFVRKFLKGRFGNMAVWLSLIIGQPLCILMYYHDYYVTHV